MNLRMPLQLMGVGPSGKSGDTAHRIASMLPGEDKIAASWLKNCCKVRKKLLPGVTFVQKNFNSKTYPYSATRTIINISPVRGVTTTPRRQSRRDTSMTWPLWQLFEPSAQILFQSDSVWSGQEVPVPRGQGVQEGGQGAVGGEGVQEQGWWRRPAYLSRFLLQIPLSEMWISFFGLKWIASTPPGASGALAARPAFQGDKYLSK